MVSGPKEQQMKCPKCGFNSFEYHDVCKKCSSDLTGYKQAHSILAIVLPKEAREALATSRQMADTAETDQATHVPETHADMFTFDLPEDEAAAPEAAPAADYNPFNFDEQPAAPAHQAPTDFSLDEEGTPEVDASAPVTPQVANANPFAFDDEPDAPELTSSDDGAVNEGQKSAQTKAEDDAFADLLESTVRDDDAGTGTGAAGAPAATEQSSPPAAPETAVEGSDEFDLENFAWDSTPAATEQPASIPAAETPAESSDEFELENFSFNNAPAATEQPSPSPAPEAASGTPGEFDLNSFSWEEPPAALPETETKPGDDTRDDNSKK
jgi:hypothetical protein